uniref:Endonuclease/exonuclease/phosphatase domain-containing protein n=1 Tax=Norrisiella sphaerica TaxID=552664 RepID=A0A7S2VV69_9EUKA
MQPGSEPYQAMTSVDPPKAYADLKVSNKSLFPLKSSPFQSAYQVLDGEEPEFTNYAVRMFRDKEISFMGCIDYIFISKHWNVSAVADLPEREETKNNVPSYPSMDQPSDHTPIAATLSLGK